VVNENIATFLALYVTPIGLLKMVYETRRNDINVEVVINDFSIF